MRFSERKGLKSIRSVIQKDGIDDTLRIGLWNVLTECLLEHLELNLHTRFRNSNLWPLFKAYWRDYFKQPVDALPQDHSAAFKFIGDYFSNCGWYEVYDFIEFTSQNAPKNLAVIFDIECNFAMEREMSAYRLVDKHVVEITAEEEISSIEDALSATTKLSGAHAHLETALGLLSDRKKPDYRNSMKESISAVESLAQALTGDQKATLGDALKVLERESKMHNALKNALSSLYGYTSDAQGIRHAMLEEENPTFIDAKFMLVACTAFVNYMIGRAAEQGLKLS